MTLSRDVLTRLHRLRDLFLDERDATQALGDYWRTPQDLAAYDSVLGARIGWKWDAALAEMHDRGFARADGACVVDFGCGSGIAARRFVRRFGAREVLCHDRSRTAMSYAVETLRAEFPTVACQPLRGGNACRPDVLLVSHVLAELDGAGETALRALIARSQRVVIVEPGSKAIARRLSGLRDALRGEFHIVAPCPHAETCPALASDRDWCHFFATPPPEVFTTGDWALIARELGIDLRSLPYAFLALTRVPAAATAPPPPPHRTLGRASIHPHTVQAQVCRATGLATVELQKRQHPGLWRALKKHPEAMRTLPE